MERPGEYIPDELVMCKSCRGAFCERDLSKTIYTASRIDLR